MGGYVYKNKVDENAPVEDSLGAIFCRREHSDEELSIIIGNLADLMVRTGVLSAPDAIEALLLHPRYTAIIAPEPGKR